MTTETYISTLVVEKCCTCGMTFGMDSDFRKRKKEEGGTFYCPSGHGQHYTETEVGDLRRRLSLTQQALSSAENTSAFYKSEKERFGRKLSAKTGQMTKLKKRIHNGVCPCCNRTFANLQQHMSNQHPDYVKVTEE